METRLGVELFEFASAVSSVLNDRDVRPGPNNSYSHETAYSPSETAAPYIDLRPSPTYSALSSTNCSGWVSYAVDTVSPMHHAVLQAQRRRPEYNREYESGFRLREKRRTWARAFVLTNFFRSDSAERHGFRPLHSHEYLRAGDLVAYSLGRYIDPPNAELPRPADTGHAFIVAGSTSVVAVDTPGYDYRSSLSEDAAEVIAVPVIDASAIPHFDPDVRKNERGRFFLPKRAPGVRLKPGGIGQGTVWFALDADGQIIQLRLGPRARYRSIVVGAVRLEQHLWLDGEILDTEGRLVVDSFDNVPALYDGNVYGLVPMDISGRGGIRLAGGRLVLGGHSDFSGDVVVEDGWLFVTSQQGLGDADLEVRGGNVFFHRPALAQNARLRLAPDLPPGSVHLDFSGRDEIWSLELDGAEYGCGTWGSPESGATHQDARFVGPGRLQLIGEPTAHCRSPSSADSE